MLAFDRLAQGLPDPVMARPDGLVAYGGSLEPTFLLCAYSRGMFPWYNAGQPILWWSPDPRCILEPGHFHLPRRSARALRGFSYGLSINAAFGTVIRSCAAPRARQGGTWITPEMMSAYERLHALGYAHSVEAWKDGRLAGGLYGVALGRAFFGESMFHHGNEASRAALSALVDFLKGLDFLFIDCQQTTPHMLGMGAKPLPRVEFLQNLRGALAVRDGAGDDSLPCPWRPWLGHGSREALDSAWQGATPDYFAVVSRS